MARPRKEQPADTSAAAFEHQLKAAARLLRVKRARENLLDFTVMSMPHPEDPDDADRSRYQPARHHKALAAALEEVEKGKWMRLIITMPPRHGKSEMASRRFPAWFVGRDPYRQVIFSTYNDTFALDFGGEVREILQSDFFGQVFPGCHLRRGSTAKDRLQTVEGGQLSFVGTGGSITGRGADLLLIDDPIKDREEADSKLVRDKLWDWFRDVALTRLMPGGRIVIIMTRWHEDDLVGRLTDPSNEHYSAEEAAQWKVLDLPAIAIDGDPIGREPGEALWPQRYDVEYLLGIKRINPRGFSALYQGRPAPDDGDYFRKDMIRGYRREELPRELRYYCGSDHAVSEAQRADKTCLLPVGVDSEGTVWVLPDVWWERKGSEAVAEAMLEMMKRRRFLVWWAENGHISKAIGPFLRRMMREQNVNCYIDEVTPVKDKETRAQSIRAMMSLGRVRFPTFAPWWQDAEAELLKFPAARHDDFVDALAHIGRGLDRQTRPAAAAPVVKKGPATGTFAWVKESSRREAQRRALEKMGGF